MLSALLCSFLRKGHSPSRLPLSPLPFLAFTITILLVTTLHCTIHPDNPLVLLIPVLSRPKNPQDYQHLINSDPSAFSTVRVLRGLLFHPQRPSPPPALKSLLSPPRVDYESLTSIYHRLCTVDGHTYPLEGVYNR